MQNQTQRGVINPCYHWLLSFLEELLELTNLDWNHFHYIWARQFFVGQSGVSRNTLTL